MTASQLYRFDAQMESLEPATAYIKAASASTGPMVALRAETALEELLTNSVMHGSAPPDEPASVWVSVTVAGQVMTLRFEDACAEFNPLLEIDAALERTRVPVEQRRPGGLGLLMVYRLADGVRYTRENGHNCIELSFTERRVE